MPPQKTGYATTIMKGKSVIIIMAGTIKSLETSFYAVTNSSARFNRNRCDKVIVTYVKKQKRASRNPSGKAKAA